MLPWDSMHPLLWTDAEVDLLEDTYAYEEIMQFRDQVSGFVRAALRTRLYTHGFTSGYTSSFTSAPRIPRLPLPPYSTGKHASAPPSSGRGLRRCCALSD